MAVLDYLDNLKLWENSCVTVFLGPHINNKLGPNSFFNLKIFDTDRGKHFLRESIHLGQFPPHTWKIALALWVNRQHWSSYRKKWKKKIFEIWKGIFERNLFWSLQQLEYSKRTITQHEILLMWTTNGIVFLLYVDCCNGLCRLGTSGKKATLSFVRPIETQKPLVKYYA